MRKTKLALSHGVKQTERLTINKTEHTVEPLILAVETATSHGSSALARGTHTLAEKINRTSLTHGEQTLSAIDELLTQTGIALAAIDFFAVSTGAGSFTGLRTGIALVKAFAYANRRLVAAVPTLYAVAHHETMNHETARLANGERQSAIALLPAGRHEVFVQRFAMNHNELIELSPPAHRAPQLVIEEQLKADESVIWCGEAAHRIIDLLRAAAMKHGIRFVNEREGILDRKQEIDLTESLTESLTDEVLTNASIDKSWTLAPPPRTSLASSIAALGYKQFLESQLVTARELSALYVRPVDIKSKLSSVK